MSDIMGFDLDGTLVRSFTAEPLPGVRERLHALPRDVKTIIATNQGGPVWRAVTGDAKYPTVARIAETITTSLGLWALDWRPDLLLICTHPGRAGAEWQQAADQVARDLGRMLRAGRIKFYVSPDLSWRKPEAGMLTQAERYFHAEPHELLYVGDMETDREAARAARCRFMWAGEWLKEG
jgi:hypothetical protein